MQLQSLQLLASAHSDAAHRRYCCRANDSWYRHLHLCSSAGGSPAASEDAIATDFREMMSADAAASSSTSPNAKEALREVLTAAHAAPNPNFSEFPGPMCSPFCRKDARLLRDGDYTVTEKSDGLRVVVVVRHVEHFPVWELEPAVSGVDSSHLVALFALEEARRALKRGEATAATGATVSLNGGSWVLKLPSADDTVAVDGESFVLSKNSDAETLWQARRRCTGRHFAYAIDRALDAVYLFLDDHSTPDYRHFVLDGELMAVLATTDGTPLLEDAPRLLLGAFDLFSYAPASTGEALILTNAPMLQRYEDLKKVFATCKTTPAEDDAGSSSSAAGCVTWYAKTMWRLADVGACVQKLQYSRERRCFLFSGPHGLTENDGLILTPDVFPIAAGSSSVQLKWKWRHLLSIDWLLQASDKQIDVYTASLFFMKKNYGHRDDVVGHWRLRRPMTIRNPHRYEMPVDAAVVAECAYDFAHRQWYVQRLRHDKRGANSIITAISVYESLVENISLPTLLELVQVHDEAALQAAAALEKAAMIPDNGEGEASHQDLQDTSLEKFATARVTLRAIRESGGNTELYLNAYTNATNKDVKFPLPFPLRRIRDCVGLGYDESTARDAVPSLEEALYIQLGNAGGCYAWSDFVVDAFYNGVTGYWELIRLNPRGNNKEAVFDNVIEHLETVLRVGHTPQYAAVLERKRDTPLVVAPSSAVAATSLTSRHYGAVAKELANAERSHLRRFNNWVKSMLYVSTAVVLRKGKKEAVKVHALDLCCGRGGDLLKWQHLHPAFLFMSDASVECVAEAAARYSTSEGQSIKASAAKGRGFPAYFAVHDAFDPASGLREDLLKRGPFQLTSCQFSMHYGCRSAESIRYFVSAVGASLAPRGRFIGTTVCDTTLLARAKDRGPAYGNNVYQVRFSPEAQAQLEAVDFDAARLPFGVPYATTVERSVQDMVEYVVPWAAFVSLCAEYQLQLVMDDTFEHSFEMHKGTAEGQKLLAEMNHKRGRDGESNEAPLSAEEAEAVQLYRLFVFEKMGKKKEV